MESGCCFSDETSILGDKLSFLNACSTSYCLYPQVGYISASKITKGRGHKFSECACLSIVNSIYEENKI